MKRLAFNGGEISPAMALRSDMDVYARSCSLLENWDLAPTGGIMRRRGMRTVGEAAGGEGVLIPFVYSESETYVVELGVDSIRVRDSKTLDIVFDRTADGESGWGYPDVRQITWQQINSLLLVCSPDAPLMQLKLDNTGAWSFERFEFKCPPWNTVDLRDSKITITPNDDNVDIYSLEYDGREIDEVTEHATGEMLRVSYYTAKGEAMERSGTLRNGTWGKYDTGSAGMTRADSFAVGDKVAVAGKIQYDNYICIKDWKGSTDFTIGCTSPANYRENFLRAEDLSGFDSTTVVYTLSAGKTFFKGTRLREASGYWKLYTCIRPWNGETDYKPGKTSPEDYPHHFIPGIAVGEAMPCKGTWKFHCSGVWFGSYEVRRCYDSPDLDSLWETLGESISPVAAAENNIITGDESQEECYLRLFLTTIRYKGPTLSAGWPSDYCGNRLLVSSYKHDMILKMTADGFLQDVSTVQIPLDSPLTTDDWSWQAFCKLYGYPTIATLHESRLVLAGTAMQPQTIWMSRTDDLDNFDAGGGDDAALLLTMNTTTQAAICWMTSHADCLMLGTEDAEWIVNSGRSGALTAGNARIELHGSIGSAHIPAVKALDRVLYCERGSGRVFQYGYNYENDAYMSTDMTIFADHIAMEGGGIIGGTVLRKPYCVAVFVLGDGTLALMSYNTLHNVNAWHRYTTQGKIKSVAALCDGMRRDKLFLLVERENGMMLEVIDADCGYVDAEGLDYVSTVETTAFTVPDANENKVPQARVQAYLQHPVPSEALVARSGTTGYVKLNHTGMLPAGWTDIVTLSGWTDRPLIGLQVRGDVGCTILAMQA